MHLVSGVFFFHVDLNLVQERNDGLADVDVHLTICHR